MRTASNEPELASIAGLHDVDGDGDLDDAMDVGCPLTQSAPHQEISMDWRRFLATYTAE